MEDNERRDRVKGMKICVGGVGGKTAICLARRNILDMMIIDGEIDGEMINVSKKNIIRLEHNAIDMVAIDEYGFVIITDENELVIIDAEFKIVKRKYYVVDFKKILCVLNNNVLIDTEQGMYEFSIFIGDNFNSSNNGGKTSYSSQVNNQNDTHRSEGSWIEVMQLKPKEIQDILNISGITLEGDEFIAVCSKDRRRIGIYLHKEPEESKDKGGNSDGLELLIPELKYLGGIDDPLSSIESFSLVPMEVKGKIFISLIIFLRHGSDLLLEEHIFTSMENGESEGSDKLGSLRQKNIDLKTEHKELNNPSKLFGESNKKENTSIFAEPIKVNNSMKGIIWKVGDDVIVNRYGGVNLMNIKNISSMIIINNKDSIKRKTKRISPLSPMVETDDGVDSDIERILIALVDCPHKYVELLSLKYWRLENNNYHSFPQIYEQIYDVQRILPSIGEPIIMSEKDEICYLKQYTQKKCVNYNKFNKVNDTIPGRNESVGSKRTIPTIHRDVKSTGDLKRIINPGTGEGLKTYETSGIGRSYHRHNSSIGFIYGDELKAFVKSSKDIEKNREFMVLAMNLMDNDISRNMLEEERQRRAHTTEGNPQRALPPR